MKKEVMLNVCIYKLLSLTIIFDDCNIFNNNFCMLKLVNYASK